MKHVGKQKTTVMLCIGMAILLFISAFLLLPSRIIAKAETGSANNGNTYSYSQLMSCADGSGYANAKSLAVGDPLVGVNVAEIKLSNFSSTTIKEGKRYFLKTSPDIPVLSIELKTDVNNLGGSGAWINEDGDTRIPDYGFVGAVGYGWLGISHTDYQGKVQTVCIKDALKKVRNNNSFMPAWFGAEGDYKVSLCFEAKRQTGTEKNWHGPFYYTNDPVYGYTNYRIDATFEIRNANAQVFAFDLNGNELLSGSVCDQFTLDFANSRYLQISVKREIAVNTNELMESTDVRFNSVGVDQRTYSTPGVWTITSRNEITGDSTIRRILVVDSNNVEETNVLKTATSKKYSEFSLLDNDRGNQGVNALNADNENSVAKNNSGIIITIVVSATVLIIAIIICTVIIKKKTY